MTGSPVIKVNLNTSRKQKIQRKLNFVRDVPENLHQLHVDNLKCNISEPSVKIQDLSKQNTKSITSSLSSFVFPDKKGVKRKLDFDIDDASDEMSSFRFSSRNISVSGLQSKNSSLADIRSVTFSPNKNLFRGSYSRSSVTSNCRRRLFADEPALKKAKLESPVIGSNNNSKKNEIRLSLKKKFPGVPNSDAARSGLLLNLAFSKYNLSTSKNENISFGFVDNNGVITKNDFVQYSSIKKDDNSHSHSPVFMSIKKVKRKLNLEEQDTSKCSIKINVPIEESIIEEQNNCEMSNISKNISNITYEQEENDGVIFENEQMDISNVERHLSSTATHTTPNSLSKIIKLSKESKLFESQKCTSPVLMKGHYGTLKQRSDLFKNSKLRSSLRNRIFNLSKDRDDAAKRVSMSSTYCSPVLNKKNFHSQHRKRSNDLKHIFNYSQNTLAQRYDRIVVKHDVVERTKRDAETLKHLSESTSSSSQLQKKRLRWVENTFSKEKDKRCSKTSKPTSDNKPNSFIASHIQRFLRDCLEAARLGIGADYSPNTSVINNKSILAEELSFSEKSDEQKINEELTNDNFKLSEDYHFRPNERLVLPAEMSVSTNRFCCIPLENSNGVNGSEEDSGNKLVKSSKIVELPDKTSCITEDSQSLKDRQEEQNKRHDFIIENADSQEINDQCIEEVELVIVSANSENSFVGNDDSHTDRTLLSQAKRFRIFEDTIDEDILMKTSAVEDTLLDDGSVYNYQDQCYKVEEISTSESMSIKDQSPKIYDAVGTPLKKGSISDHNETFDSEKKGKRKRRPVNSNTLVARLNKSLNRENSEARMWEYELSKRNNSSILEDYGEKPAVYCVEKMWKEFSHLILLCSFVNQDKPDELYNLDEMKDWGIPISNLVIIIMEPEFCPKNLTYSSIFRVHPPWRILHSMRSDPVILLRPCKVEIVSQNGKSIFYRDPTLPSNPKLIKETQYCTCCDVSCDCFLPEGYQTVIRPLLLPSEFDFVDYNNYSYSKNYSAEDLESASHIVDVVLKHKLYSAQCLQLDLHVLHVHRYEMCGDKLTFHHIICVDNSGEVCCVVVRGERWVNLSTVTAEVLYRFFGILPWKLIPKKSVSLFMDHVKLFDASDILEKNDKDICIFTLSKKYGNIKRLN